MSFSRFAGWLLVVVSATLLIFLVVLELYVVHIKRAFLSDSSAKMDFILQRLFLYEDTDHFMRKDRHMDLNSNGIRSPHEPQDIKEEDINIVFLGDSFVYGFLLPSEMAIPSQFEKQAREKYPDKKINSLNFGWVSSSPLLDKHLLESIGNHYHPDVVILSLDIGDFGDDILYQRIIERRDIYIFSRFLPGTTLLLESFANMLSDDMYERVFGYPKSIMFANEWPLQRSKPYITQFAQQNIDEIARYTADVLHARFILVMNPRAFHYNLKEAPDDWNHFLNKRTENSFEIFRYFDELERSRSYPVVSLLQGWQATRVFPSTFSGDSHWNAAGCSETARLLLQQCEALSCFGSSDHHE